MVGDPRAPSSSVEECTIFRSPVAPPVAAHNHQHDADVVPFILSLFTSTYWISRMNLSHEVVRVHAKTHASPLVGINKQPVEPRDQIQMRRQLRTQLDMRMSRDYDAVITQADHRRSRVRLSQDGTAAAATQFPQVLQQASSPHQRAGLPPTLQLCNSQLCFQMPVVTGLSVLAYLRSGHLQVEPQAILTSWLEVTIIVRFHLEETSLDQGVSSPTPGTNAMKPTAHGRVEKRGLG